MNWWKRRPQEQRTLNIAIHDDDGVTLFPLDIRREGNAFLIGRRESRTYVAVPEVAVDIISTLNEKRTIGEVRRRFQADYDNANDAIDGFLVALLNNGFVDSIGGKPVETDLKIRPPQGMGIQSRHVAWLFSKVMMTLCALVILAGALVVLFDPHVLPRPLTVLSAYPYWLFTILSLVVGIVNVTKHESAHVLAAAFLGVRADLSIGHRMFFPVIQTDLTSLWAVDRNDRYIAYSAGIVSDLVTIALIVISFWLNAHGIVAVGEPFQLLLTIALLVVTTTVVWQFNFFMKTDVYYIFANALGCRNLHADAIQYLRHLLRRAIRRYSTNPLDGIPSREAWAIRLFSGILAAGTFALTTGGCAYAYTLAWSVKGHASQGFLLGGHAALGEMDKAIMLFLILLTVGSVIYSVRKNRRRPKATYRLIAEAKS